MKAIKEYAEASAWKPKGGDQLRLFRLATAGFTRKEAKLRLEMSDSYFNGIYKQLKDYMSLGVLNSSLNELTKVQKIHCIIHRNYATAKMLILQDKKTAGISLARTTIKRAEEQNLFQIALDLSRSLRSHFGHVAMNAKQYELYTEKQKRYKSEMLWEMEAEDVFSEFSHLHLKGKQYPELGERLQALSKLPSSSHRFHYLRFYCQALHDQIIRDENNMLLTCKKALSYFQQYQNLPYAYYFTFYYLSIAVYLAQGAFAKAELLLNQSLSQPARGGKNWQILMLHRALLGFHSGKVAITIDAYQQALKVPKKLKTEQVEERWRIIRAYLELSDPGLGKWRLAKFMNGFTYSLADKQGPILSVHIVELMHLLKSNQLEKYHYRCERLTAYIDRYLKKEGMERNVQFLRLLQCVVRGGFVRIEVQKKAKPYIKQLQQHTPRIGADVREVEVVPFERLWEMVLGWLK